MGENPHGEGHNFPRGFVFPGGVFQIPAGISTFTAKYFLGFNRYVVQWHRIYSVDPILYKSSHLKPSSPLDVLGEFAKNQFGKNFLTAVNGVFALKGSNFFPVFNRNAGKEVVTPDIASFHSPDCGHFRGSSSENYLFMKKREFIPV